MAIELLLMIVVMRMVLWRCWYVSTAAAGTAAVAVAVVAVVAAVVAAAAGNGGGNDGVGVGTSSNDVVGTIGAVSDSGSHFSALFMYFVFFPCCSC